MQQKKGESPEIVQHTFHETLEQLKILQKVLNDKFELERKLVELPKEIALQEQMVFRMKENFLTADTQYRDFKKNLEHKQDELNRLQEHRERYEKEIIQVNSQRDYEQIDRAIKENLEQEQIMRGELHALESKFNVLEEEFTSTENLLKVQEETLKKMKVTVDVQLLNYSTTLQGIRNKETNITAFLDDKLVFKFERIIKSKGGEGIVPIKKNVCNGCHMVLPLQFVNEVRKEDTVLNCPYCSKILYYSGKTDEDTIETEEISGLQDLFEDEDIVLDDFEDEDYELFLERDNIGSDSYSVSTENEEGEEGGGDTEEDFTDEENLEEDEIEYSEE